MRRSGWWRVAPRLGVLAAATVGVGATLVGTAGVASAADLGTVTFSCRLADTEQSVVGQVGDTFTAQSQSEYDCVTVATSSPGVVSWTTDDPDGSTHGPDPSSFYGYVDYQATPKVGTTVTFQLTRDGSTTWVATQNGHGLTIHFTVGDGTAADAPLPPPWVQSYGRASQDAPCQDGWTPSWSQWPHGGLGGYVCDRSIPSVGS